MKNNTIDTKEQDKSEIQVKPQASLRIENEADDKVTSHEYFVLIPETKAETDKKEVKTDIEVENEYDHLIHNPKHTIVDASTYNHINIKTGTVDGEVVNIDQNFVKERDNCGKEFSHENAITLKPKLVQQKLMLKIVIKHITKPFIDMEAETTDEVSDKNFFKKIDPVNY